MQHTETMADPKLRPGSKFCQCAACGAYFTNDGNFLKHRRGGGCLTPTQMQHRGLVLNDRGYWQGPVREAE